MKRKGIVLSVILCLLLCFSLFAVVGHADFGDYGGDSDYGGGWDSGGGYDSDSDWGSSSSSSGGDLLENAIILVIVVVVIIVSCVIGAIVSKIKKWMGIEPKNKPGKPVAPGAAPTDPRTLRPMAEFNALDPGFSAGALCEQLSNRYVQFQNAWQAKDLSPLRPYLTDALYAQMDRQLENNYRRTRQTNRVERIAVLGVQPVGWRQDSDVDVIVARLRTRIVDYVVDDATGRVIRGSATAEKFMEYEWTLIRASGVITGQTDRMTVHNCPNCGAVLNINQTARCEYCGSIVTVQAHEWAVSNIKGLSQHTTGR